MPVSDFFLTRGEGEVDQFLTLADTGGGGVGTPPFLADVICQKCGFFKKEEGGDGECLSSLWLPSLVCICCPLFFGVFIESAHWANLI